jgi:hypothetical protein
MVMRRIAAVWIALVAAGASDTACNAILGNQAHELASSGTEDGSAAPDGPADTFDGPAEGTARGASLDAVASPDAAGEMDGLFGSSEGAFDSGAGDGSAADAVDSQASPQDAPDGRSFDASDATANESGPTDAGFDAEAGAPCTSRALSAKTATTSSVHASPPATLLVDGPAPLAIDGQLSTRWEAEWMRDPSWIDLDFGAAVYVSEVDIIWETACAANYTIEVSRDEANWSVVKNGVVTGNSTASQIPPTDWSLAVKHANLSGAGRYLRIHGTVRCQALYGYSIWEIRVFGDPNATCQP